MNRMTRDQALDLATDHYMMGNIDVNLPYEATDAEIEETLSRWDVKIVEEN